MYAASALRQYQQVSTQSQLAEASPHRLIQMLFEGALDRLAQAQGALARGQVAEKGLLIGKVIGIVGGLREGLDKGQGGELAQHLDGLYEYMIRQLAQANLKNDEAILRQVAQLLRELKEGWDGIA
ncbi:MULTISPECIES: flagellar export chaperone FliS [Pseudomonadaceae]|uniref:Flagellar protein FliS n=3 Tax=Pseudomonadaceae TaxID=135621 RepID=A0A1H2LNF6_9PSED|nr:MULTISPECIES: flagellar export chaperone FliS [Pseudomonas]MDG9757395.1 flagellar export chaperone FliS [Pseudomonas sediminis]MDH1340809.1 flagellar export chaperone FliS [Pseudomonas oleovorans]MDH1493469.1 flagellar export chaperone FliS [Pseudomonas oleovorans]MDH1621985.1 flagellar export chaperone FliS [Pseudomonas chengduensis]MDH1868699.1 flagellar export chaperone FliS [Pseudomonas chengduensis]